MLCLAGCASPFEGLTHVPVGPPLEALHEIDAIRLEDESRSEPVTVEEAAEEAVEELIERHPPPQTLDLNLSDVRAAALANNLDLKVELISPSIAQTRLDEEEAKFEAIFTGSARRTTTDRPTELATESSEATIDNFQLGLLVPLATGGQINLTVPFSRSETNNVFSLLDPAYSANAQFSISQPLLRGGGFQANMYSIHVARYNRKISNAQTKLEAIRILANADRAYWLLYAAQRQLQVRVQQYELAVEQLEQARRKVNAGDAPEIEVIRAESGVASRLEAILVVDTLVRRRRRDLKRILNRADLPMESPTALALNTDPGPVYLDLDPVALGEYAVTNRMEMLELELQLAIDASSIKLERNAALPLFTVDYTYNINGLRDSYDHAFDQVFARDFDDWSVGLRAEIPIGNEAAKARVHRAILTRVQRLATRDLRRLAILQEVYDAVDQLNQEWQRILAARQAVILAARTLEGERRQFEVGIRTSTDVLDAAARLADAQSSEVQALTAYEIARVDIAFG
ncbi:MAG: TolC family protein, partial [Planctomycetota bacterium]